MKNHYRDDFPIFRECKEPFIYLDSAATTHKPKAVIDEMSSFMQREYATVHRAIYSSSQVANQKYQHARELAARFISANAQEIVFTRGTTSAINFLARAFEPSISENEVILISAIEHHANFLPWVELARRKKAKLIEVPFKDGEIDLNFVEEVCKRERVFLMSIAHISNVLGIEQPIRLLSDLLHQHGALCVVDAAQSAGHLKLDVKELGVDFLGFSGHKIYGPTGIGILFGRSDLLKKLPPVEFGGDMVIEAGSINPVYQDPPLRFEAGTPSIVEVIGLAKAMEYLMHNDMDQIADMEKQLILDLGKRLQEIEGIELIGPLNEKRGSLLSFHFQGLHTLDVATFLDARGICIRSGHLCAQPSLKYFKVPSLMRVSVGIYTDESEIDYFANSLDEIAGMLLSKMY